MALLDSKEKQSDGIPKAIREEEDDIVDSCVLSAFRLRSTQLFSAALNAATELHLFDIIAEEGGRHVSASEVASRLPSLYQHRDLAFRIDRLLRVLASHSLLNCCVRDEENEEEEKDGPTERLYALSSIGRQCVSGSLGFVPIFCHPALVKALLNLKDAIINEDSDLFKKTHGMPMYEYGKTDPTWNKTFNEEMSNVCNIEMRRILELYEGFKGISTLVDVGGGNGQNLKMILSKHPSIKGVNFDLPHVVQNAPSFPGIEHVGGDMFQSVPKGDAIILKAVCHNWSDENCIKMLKKCHESLPEKGKVIMVEFIMPEDNKATEEVQFVSMLDNLMFVLDGRERTEKEFESLCKMSGFSSFKVACRVFKALGVMEFRK